MGFLEQSQQEIFNMENFQTIYCSDTVGRTIETALLKAETESRLIIGLPAAIKVLSNKPEKSLICLMAEPQIGDSATHMHEVLLEAFCYENDIYVIKVDSAKKLSRILGRNSIETCCLIQKRSAYDENANLLDEEELLTKSENILVDHCETYWNSPKQPIIKLPEM